jgi:periplasmic protein TonB
MMRIKKPYLLALPLWLFFHAPAFSQSSEEQIKSLQAELAELKKAESIGPKKTILTRQTRAVGQAMYLRVAEQKIERIGTASFPEIDGKRHYGKLVVSIPIFQDGTIFERDGGPKVERSSGDVELDESALNIVRQAAPFGAIPNNLRSKDRDDVWVIITTFNFTNEKVPLDADNGFPR